MPQPDQCGVLTKEDTYKMHSANLLFQFTNIYVLVVVIRVIGLMALWPTLVCLA